jgi:DNA-binding GntR family transcriptional regulator
VQDKPRSRSEHAYAYLIEQLQAGRGKPGETISTYALAEELSMSRSPIVEALKRLEAEGLVEIVPQVGCSVVRPSAAALRELHAVRGALEGLTAGLAAARVSRRDLRDLHSLLARMSTAADAGDRARFEDLDRGFHMRLVEIGQLPRATAILRGVWAQLQLERSRAPISAEGMAESLEEHLGIMRALEQGDPLAARRRAERHALRCSQASTGRPSSSPA